MQMNEAFQVISDKVEEALSAQGFKKAKVESYDPANELIALFVSENIAYSIIYYKDRMHTLLRECPMTDDGPDNDWKTLATWMFDPETDGMKEATSIGNDFVDAISAPKAIKRAKATKKSKGKKDDDGNADPVFLSKRFVTLFPELKDEIIREEDCYYPFRGVTFARESIVPRVNKLVESGSDADIKKLCSILSAQYSNGDADTRSIITIVIINSVPSQYDAKLDEFFSDDLKKAAKYARKLRGKNIKPEVEKKPKQTVAQRLERYQK